MINKPFMLADTMDMIRKRILFLIAFICCFWPAGSAKALDLGQFQGFMQPKLTPSQAPRVIPAKKFKDVIPENERQNFVNIDADAAPTSRKNQLITLPGPRQGRDALTLPPETRIPMALRPMMTDRKYPREGISLSGNTGSLLIPSPGVLEPNKTAVSIHALAFDLYDVNDVKYKDSNYFDTSAKLTYGAMEGLEFGIDKIFSNQDRFDVLEPLYVNAKYQVPGNVTVGGNFSTDSGYHSLYVTAGVLAVWVGAGVNFGPEKFHFYYNGWDKLRRAKFGGYNYDYTKAEGYADPAFFMVGGAVPITKSMHFLYDFNGDKFSLGFRLNYQRIVYFDASYISDGDYERLPGAISHKVMSNFVFGGSVVF